MKAILNVSRLLILSLFLTVVSCSTDPCEGSLCMNGGVCVDGSCDCPDRYTGASCDQQATPDRIRISGVTAIRFPGMNGDIPWDDADGADIYFKLYDMNAPIAQPILPGENANPESEYNFFISNIDMHNPLNEHNLQLWDFDPVVDDQLMGEIKFQPYHVTNNFPETMILDIGGPVAFRLTFEYVYNVNR